MLAALPLLAALTASAAVAPSGPKQTFGVIEENDVFALGGGDSHYTQGLKLFYLRRDDSGLVKRLEPNWFPPEGPAEYVWGVSLGQNMYTPRDISLAAPVPDDRAYAGWLYLGLLVQRRQKAVHDTLELDAGVMGPDSKAEEAQRLVHRVIRVGQPQGWASNQLGTAWAANVSFQRRWRGGRVVAFDLVPFDVIPHSGAAAGNVQDYVNMGNTIRMGLWGLPEDFGPDFIMTPAASDPGDGGFGAYLFTRVDGRLVVYDAFLDRRRPGGFPLARREPFVADAAVGLALRCGSARLTWSQLWRTPEFKTQVSPHHYASLSGSFSF